MNACAYVVGDDAAGGLSLEPLARKLGFDVVLPYSGMAEAERRSREPPLAFFFFAEVQDLKLLAAPIEAIRGSGADDLRFAPLIYFCRKPSMEVIRRSVGMGFDDIITEPFTPERVAGRLSRQVSTELAYYQTPSYFGPDRRRHDREPRSEEAQGGFRRVEIFRDPASGISVVHDDAQVML
jgi:hypothetical protein